MMNDEMEQFERRLRQQPLRQVPAEWRAEILRAGRRAAVREITAADPASLPARLSAFSHQLSTLFWPHPKVWAGLAAIWIFIFAVNVSMRDEEPVMARKPAAAPEITAELKQEKRLLVELIGPRDISEADRSKSFVPLPRSERVEFLTV
jgi:hypothetical protein